MTAATNITYDLISHTINISNCMYLYMVGHHLEEMRRINGRALHQLNRLTDGGEP